MAYLLAAAMVASAATSALSQYQQGQYGKTVASRQSEALEIQARQTQQQAGAEIAAQDYQAAKVLGTQTAVAGASGVAEEGSTSIIRADSAEEAQINDMYAQYAANLQASNLYYQGTLGKSIAEQGAEAGTIGAITGGTTGAIESGIEAYSLKTKTAPFTYTGGTA